MLRGSDDIGGYWLCRGKEGTWRLQTDKNKGDRVCFAETTESLGLEQSPWESGIRWKVLKQGGKDGFEDSSSIRLQKVGPDEPVAALVRTRSTLAEGDQEILMSLMVKQHTVKQNKQNN
jgi:hypothetical protein